MPSCVLRDCFNHSRKSKKSEGVTFHRFLLHGHEKREAWIQFVQKNRNEENWLPTDHTYICSLHFKDDDKYSTKTGRIYLKKSAVPYDYKSVIQPPAPAPGCSGLSVEKCHSMEPISEPVSDSESIFDTPRKIVLKKIISKETTARKNLAQKLKKVLRQNRYLRKKCESYRLMIKDMKNKYEFDAQAE